MTAKELVEALNAGRLSEAIVDAWLRAGRAELLAIVGIGLALVACAFAAVALARTGRKP